MNDQYYFHLRRRGGMIIAGAMVLTLWMVPAFAGEEQQPPQASTRLETLLQQRREKSQQLMPFEVSKGEARVHAWEKAKFPLKWLVKGWHGLRPAFGGMPSGSGFVYGAGYIHGLDSQYYQAQVNGRYSTSGYTMFDGEIIFPPPQVGPRLEFKLDGAYRDFASLRFFGLGNESSVDDRTTYLLRDKNLNGHVWFNPRGIVSLGVQAGILRARTDSGESEQSLDEVFDPRSVHGFGLEDTDYGTVGGWLEVDLRNKWEEPNVGVVLRLTGLRYNDRDLNQFDFTRLIGDVKGYIPLGPKSRILALRFRTSHSKADSGHDVPFYLMETLGGSGTVRGFREYRFRDNRNLLRSR